MKNSLKTRELKQLAALIEQALRRKLPTATKGPPVIHLAMRHAVFSGGKRFRPLLCLGACRAVGAPIKQALSAACAVELIHAYSLVHDDLPAMDNAYERRGQPSCHRKFGQANAILAGDALLTLAFEVLSQNNTPNALATIRTLGEASGTVGLIGGQVLDLQVIKEKCAATQRILTEIARRKTAALITASVVAGALAGGAGASELNRLKQYGEAIGLAFQLIDDIHDGEGFTQVLGEDRVAVRAQRLIEQAFLSLRTFGRRADVLRQLTTWLAAS